MKEISKNSAPLDEIDRLIRVELTELTTKLEQHRPERIIELARLACLPWNMAGMIKPDTDGGPAKAELLALIALTTDGADNDGSATDEIPNSLYQAAHEWAESVEKLIELLQAREFVTMSEKTADDLDRIAFSARSTEVWLRSSSYPDMVKSTHDALFEHEAIPAALSALLGFDASDAYRVLTRLHDLQVDAMNDRLEEFLDVMGAVSESGETAPTSETLKKVRIAINIAWQPTADLVAVSTAAVADSLGVEIDVVEAVLNWFAVDLGEQDTHVVLESFVKGDNPFRTNPVVRTERGEFMLVHDALVLPAIRENLEQALKTSQKWEQYQKWRGDLLEDLGRTALERVLPGATTYSAFDYFVPANEQEALVSPSEYTKKVEGDLLFILDDVAIIVEAKAAAITPAARAGETRKLRRSLTDIITKASSQAARLQKRIEDDRGVRFHESGWLDLDHIREIHTIALSLDDLSGVATATSDLVQAGFLDASHIPWVVSVHDLQVIVDVVDRPAEFLLYLRRRRDPEVSLAYVAPDELDLFLYFYEAGLYVVPDPQLMTEQLPYMHSPSKGDLRRRAKQGRSLITSRTGPLDAWHSAKLDPALPRVNKPVLTGSPMIPLAEKLQKLGFYGWLSLGATLLSGSTKAQKDFSRISKNLLAHPRDDGRERSQAVPIGSSLSNAWLLIWMTRPAGRDVEDVIQVGREYLRAKKYQLKINRGAVFLYDEATKELINVTYDGTLPTPDPMMDRAIVGLVPVDKMPSPPPPNAKRASKGTAKRKKRKKR
ncbi:hypothetical protein [Glutamicibacter arilaitensis]|uniref:hypothetical protein n=1 Tax=Glutamicibacter arilaitensis TaxID=256701 RepID=UPI00384DBDE4